MRFRPLLLAGTAGLFLLSAGATAAPRRASEAPVPAPAAAVVTTADAALKQLFADSDEASLKRNPLNALFRGDLRYADHLGDLISDAYFDAERAAAESDLKRLQAIDRAALSPTDQIAYDVFKWQTEVNLKGLAPDMLALTVVRPLDHFYGIQTFYPDLSSGTGAAPFKTVEDYENGLKRHHEYVVYLDRAIGRFREGMKSGVVQPKLVVRNMIEQFDVQLKQGVEGSTFYQPVTKFPDGISAADQARLKAAYAATIRDDIFPAYVRMRDFLKNDYLPVARDSVGLGGMPGGDRLYAYMIEQNTTLPMSAAEVHRLGLAEVARITREMEAAKAQVGFKGDLKAFFAFLRSDPRFKPKSKDELRDGYTAIGKRVDLAIPSQFAVIPKTPLVIRPVPEYKEKTEAGGYYEQGTPDGSRPGVFYYNGYDLPSRYKWDMETLYLHEAVPGHHFQISLAQENADLPAFMRFGGNTAFVEGWALYAESLWKELGMETDPYQRMGGLSDEMLRAMRLVVDSGIHSMGWTRDQSIKYMLDNSPMSPTDATAEVERYIAIPGQALAYKVGQLTIRKERTAAEKALGSGFDPRKFHDQVLNTGALPMTVLESKIDAWIKAGGK
ncbi:DUF885 domain-containing protein [Flavisphingomonas formosensis]|uniref:DUF885 domain-containing protein n=1 Tax=Flavisphingomonas formosensis TaxID=861534 RepID=UPI0012F872C6|nr:DUF885 domain-containing protein [Sphingomonas formosensis]